MPNLVSFESKIPSHLLENASPEMAYLMNELSKNTQATEYLLRKREESGEKLDEISKKLDYTNSKTAKVMLEIAELQKKEAEKSEDWAEIEQILTIKKFSQKYLFNKTFAILFFGATFILWQSGAFLMLVRWAAKSLGLV